MSQKLDVLLLDNSSNIIEEINIVKPKSYDDLRYIINERFKQLPQNYIIYFQSNENNKTIINNNEIYKLTKDILFISENNENLLEKSLYQINYNNLPESKRVILDDKFTCILCTMNIKDENPFLCYKCQKIFHQECLKKWDKTRKLQNQALCCPICRNILPLEKWNIKIGYKEIRKQVAEYLNEESINNNIDNIINKMQQNKIRELMEEMKDMKEKYNKFIELTKEAYKNIIVQINKINSLFETNPIKIEENLQNPQINDLSNSIIKNLEMIYNSIQLKLKEKKIDKNKIKEENLKNKM